MINLAKLTKQPIFFERNRVYRIYLGGKGFFNFFENDEGVDNYFPEEWIASPVKAVNPKYFGQRDGVSKVLATDIFFDDLIAEYKDDMLGNRKFDCLVKLLDSYIRLPIQVHPNKEFSQKYFDSTYGKTEAWLVVATREDAKIYFGFKDKITKEEFAEYVERSMTEKDIMTSIISYVPAKVGDVYLIRAGLVHAIGSGCTILEVQEPTDFTIQPEYWCGDYYINDKEKYIGLTKSEALDCFDYNLYGKDAIAMAKIMPQIVEKKDTYTKEVLISYTDTTCFAKNRHTLSKGAITMNYAPSVWVVLDGYGQIVGDNYNRQIRKGDYFFLPFAAQNNFVLQGEMTLCECLPSKQ